MNYKLLGKSRLSVLEICLATKTIYIKMNRKQNSKLL